MTKTVFGRRGAFESLEPTRTDECNKIAAEKIETAPRTLRASYPTRLATPRARRCSTTVRPISYPASYASPARGPEVQSPHAPNPISGSHRHFRGAFEDAPATPPLAGLSGNASSTSWLCSARRRRSRRLCRRRAGIADTVRARRRPAGGSIAPRSTLRTLARPNTRPRPSGARVPPPPNDTPTPRTPPRVLPTDVPAYWSYSRTTRCRNRAGDAARRLGGEGGDFGRTRR